MNKVCNCGKSQILVLSEKTGKQSLIRSYQCETSKVKCMKCKWTGVLTDLPASYTR